MSVKRNKGKVVAAKVALKGCMGIEWNAAQTMGIRRLDTIDGSLARTYFYPTWHV